MHRLERQLTAALLAAMHGRRAVLPEAGALIWRAFADLTRTRSWHAHGPNPISLAEIEAWCRLHRMPLEPRHVALIRALDEAWIGETHRRLAEKMTAAGDPAAAKPARGSLGARSSRPLTPDLFDAMFG